MMDKLRTGLDVSKLFDKEFSRVRGSLVEGWTLRLNPRLRNTLGVCRHSIREIELNGNWAKCAPEEELLDTIRHELAHAVLPAGKGHGVEWKLMAAWLGARPEQYSSLQKALHGYRGYLMHCADCRKLVGLRARRPKRARRCRCGGEIVYSPTS
jgi:predicted SprT family Zn-dependent metalloprotease